MHGEQFELRDAVYILKRRRRVIGSSIIATVALALLFNALSTPVYESVVSLRVKYYQGPNETVVSMAPDELQRQQIATYTEIIKSRSVVEAAIARLYGNIPQKPSYEGVVGRINTKLVNGTQVLAISVDDPSPQAAQAMTNALQEAFLARLTEMVRAEGKETRLFIGDRMKETRRQLDDAEVALVKFKKQHMAVSLSDQTKSSVDLQADLTKLTVDNQLALEQAQARLGRINEQIRSSRPGFIADSPQIQLYKSKLAEEEVELVTLRRSFKEAHPRVAALQAAIKETRQGLNREIEQVVKAEAPSSNPVYQSLLQSKWQTESDLAVAAAKQATLSKLHAGQEQELGSLPEKEQGLARLMRDYTVAEEAYTTLAKRYEQARIDEVTQPTNVQVIDRADLPQVPARPRAALNLVLALIMGSCIGMLLAFLQDYLQKTVDTAGDVRRYLELPVLGSLPVQRVRRGSSWRRLLNYRKMKNGRAMHYEQL